MTLQSGGWEQAIIYDKQVVLLERSSRSCYRCHLKKQLKRLIASHGRLDYVEEYL